MKVQILMESVDGDGNVTQSQVHALMEIKNQTMLLSYVEDLSGEGHKTRCNMQLTQGQLRVIRKGEVNTDFIYGNCMTHNTTYETMFGTIPVTLQTEKFLFSAEGIDLDDVEVTSDFYVQLWIHYSLCMGGDEPVKMKLSLKVNKAE